jgi:hypothetical protein
VFLSDVFSEKDMWLSDIMYGLADIVKQRTWQKSFFRFLSHSPRRNTSTAGINPSVNTGFAHPNQQG